AVGKPQLGDGLFYGNTGDIDDAAKFALRHAVNNAANQVKSAVHVVVKRCIPVFLCPVTKVSWRWPAGVVDKNVGVGAGRQNTVAPLLGGDIGNDSRHFVVKGISYFSC